MTHTPITDAMVERACAAGNNGTGREIMRVMLEAALNQPEIPVSEAMIEAGLADWRIGNSARCKYATTQEFMAGAYRAMERVRRAELQSSENTTQAVYAASNQAQQNAAQAFITCPECGIGSYHGQPSHMPNCSHAHLLFP